MMNIEQNILLLIVANLVAILQLIASIKWPRLARISFFLLFSWACWINWKTAHENPADYLNYATVTWSDRYKNFINGWFAGHIQPVVSIIAVFEGLIGISMLLKGWIFKIGGIGAIIFLVAILPFGIGSGFPCTAIMAIAIFILIKKHGYSFVWDRTKTVSTSK
jgi:hypothetical protein